MPDSLPKIPTDSASVTPAVITSPSLLKNHQLQKQHDVAIPVEKTDTVWPGVLSLLIISLLVFCYVRYFKKIKLWGIALFSLQSAKTLDREDFKSLRQPSLAMSVIYLFSATLFLFQVNARQQLIAFTWPEYTQGIIILIGVTLVFLIKTLFNRLIGHLSGTDAVAIEYNFNLVLSAQATGIFLIPVVICIQFLRADVSFFYATGGFIYLIFFLIRLIKGIGICLGSRSISVFHIFLYLCTIEILPLFVLFKIITALN